VHACGEEALTASPEQLMGSIDWIADFLRSPLQQGLVLMLGQRPINVQRAGIDRISIHSIFRVTQAIGM
jgi:hypothetical protein